MTTEQAPRAPDLTGLVRDTATGEGLSGYRVEVLRQGAAARRVARGISGLGGLFALRFQPAFVREAGPRKTGGPPVVIAVRNRFGHEVHRSRPIRGAARFRSRRIDVRVRAEHQRPPGRGRPDPVPALVGRHEAEGAALRQAGVSDLVSLRAADLERISRDSGVARERLAAVRLEAELSDDGLGWQPALEIARETGIDSREGLALANPRQLAVALGTDGSDVETNARVVGWVHAASGHDASDFAAELPAQVLASAQQLARRVGRINPTAEILDVPGLHDPTVKMRMQARARSLMIEAGVHDLSTLGKFRLRKPRRIEPGFHIAKPLAGPSGPLAADAGDPLERLVEFGRRRYKRVEMHADSIHFVTNPIQDAVILGSVVELAEDGELIIGAEVSRLVIITDEIVYGEVLHITYEGQHEVPRTPVQKIEISVGDPSGTATVYEKEPGSKGPPYQGRHGGDGPPGAPGTLQAPGDELSPAPDLAIYVKRTPRGLPDISLEGRSGGAGQDGGYGGIGGDGSRGGPSKAANFPNPTCKYGPGDGGRGGRGGDGGRGARGGKGGTGGSVEIITLHDNVERVDSGREAFINMDGGPGGPGGLGGPGGRGGYGGMSGEYKGVWCHGMHSYAPNGQPGADGKVGRPGELGDGGEFSIVALSLKEWDAAINRPWIARLESSEGAWIGHAGEPVTLVGIDLIANSTVLFEDEKIAPDSIDLEADTLVFTVPAAAQGGQNTVRLRARDGDGGLILTDPVEFRVLPKLLSVFPDHGVPNQEVTIAGSGFQPLSEIQIGSRSFRPSHSEDHPTTRMSLKLPDHESIGLPSGPHGVRVLNPDHRESNAATFELSRDLVLRIKAWRVKPDRLMFEDEDSYPKRSEKSIRNLIESGTLESIWGPHRIHFVLDPEIEDITVPGDVAVNWPRRQGTKKDNAILKARNPNGSYKHFDEGAVNAYFVHYIDDNNNGKTYGYVSKPGNVEDEKPGSHIIFADNSILPALFDAIIFAHEIGHFLSLRHQEERRYLMMPGFKLEMVADFLKGDLGTTITPAEAGDARIVATPLHDQ